MIQAINWRDPSAQRPGGIVKGSGTPAASDSFTPTHVPTEMSMGDVRALAEASRLSEVGEPKKVIDINKIPFGVEIELEGFDMAAATPEIVSQPAWDQHHKYQRWTMKADASLSSKTGGEAISPVMILEGGEAARQIQSVVKHMTALGGKPTRNCGLHVHVDVKALGEKGLTTLMMLALEQENILFRLSQNGAKVHRGLIEGHGMRKGLPFYYGQPLTNFIKDPFPLIHAGSNNEFRNELYTAVPEDKQRHRPPQPRQPLPPPNSDAPWRPDHHDSVRYMGINLNAFWYQGTIEFRFFEATTDPEQIMENVQTALGLIKAAGEGNYTYLRPEPLTMSETAPVSRENFEYFLSRVAHTPALKERLRRTFEASGGVLKDDAPVTDPNILNTCFLMEQGYQFSCEGKRVHSPFELVDQLGKRDVTASLAGEPPVPVAHLADLENLVTEVEGRLNLSAGDQATAAQAIASLRERNFTFKYAPAAGGSNANVVLQKDAQILGAITRGRLMVVPPSAEQEAVTVPDVDFLDRYAKIECQGGLQMTPEQQEMVKVAETLRDAGLGLVAESRGTRYPLVSRHAIIDAISRGQAQIPVSDREFKTLSTLDEVKRAAAILKGTTAGLDAPTAAAIHTLRGLEEKGATWTTAEGRKAGLKLNRLGQLDKLSEGTLVGVMPSRIIWGFGYRYVIDVDSPQNLQKLGRKFSVAEPPAAPEAHAAQPPVAEEQAHIAHI